MENRYIHSSIIIFVYVYLYTVKKFLVVHFESSFSKIVLVFSDRETLKRTF